MAPGFTYEDHKYRQAKAWLDGLADLLHDAQAAKAMADTQRSLMLSVRGHDPGRPAGGGYDDGRLAKAVDRFSEAARDYEQAAAVLVGRQRDAMERIRRLPDARCRRCLGLRYLCGWRWERIEDAMGYSRDGMKSLHRRAVIAMWDELPWQARDPASHAVPVAEDDAGT